uniref:Uncharacterized protein n=1 Tax=Spodoptera littoralis nuclear polyhedrosis virus TaxID=10456 RepID=A0A3G4S941_NPVSL|nr:hypothetical protein [Spodoptera littoralis nucleopolyhedrovirus]
MSSSIIHTGIINVNFFNVLDRDVEYKIENKTGRILFDAHVLEFAVPHIRDIFPLPNTLISVSSLKRSLFYTKFSECSNFVLKIDCAHHLHHFDGKFVYRWLRHYLCMRIIRKHDRDLFECIMDELFEKYHNDRDIIVSGDDRDPIDLDMHDGVENEEFSIDDDMKIDILTIHNDFDVFSEDALARIAKRETLRITHPPIKKTRYDVDEEDDDIDYDELDELENIEAEKEMEEFDIQIFNLIT